MRQRIVTVTVLTALLSIVLFGVPLAIGVSYYFRLHERTELRRVAFAVASAAPDNLVSGVKLTEPQHTGFAYQAGLYDKRATLVSGHGDPEALPIVQSAIAGKTVVRTVSGRLAVAVPVRDAGTIIGAVLATARPFDARDITIGWLVMTGLALGVLAVTWVVARRQARFLAAPLEQLSAQAELLGDGDLQAGSVRSGISEVDSVYQAMDLAATRLKLLIERERAFSTEASHQLRTPLTNLSLTLDRALVAPDPRPEIGASLAIVARLDETVTDMLRLARGSRTAAAIDLDRLYQHIAARWDIAPHDPTREIRLVIEPDVPIGLMSASAARQIVDVLIDNAAQHGIGTVTVTARNAQGVLAIDVMQAGPPLERQPQDLFASGDAGSPGIGLRLARTIARSEGARLIVSSSDPTTFTVLIPTRRSDEAGAC